MKPFRSCIRKLFVAVAAAALVSPLSGHAKGALVIDLRATSVTGPAAIVDAHHVQVIGTGVHIEVDIWAEIHGSNSNPFDDGLVSASGALFSRATYGDPYYDWIYGGLTAVRDPRFMGLGGSNGTQTDLDGDGDLDVGGNDPTNPLGYFAARNNEAPNPVLGSEIRIGHASFNVDSITSATGLTRLYFAPRESPTAAFWYEDGRFVTPNSPNAEYFSGFGVAVSAAPEPGALSMLAAVAGFASALRPRRS